MGTVRIGGDGGLRKVAGATRRGPLAGILVNWGLYATYSLYDEAASGLRSGISAAP
jgi:hypothetical protein